MRFERIALENFKCYANAELSLDTGVTVIHGLNGSGKSSLLEACFFAMYGVRALDRTLEELVRVGTDEAVVGLWFAHDGGTYHVERRIRVRESGAGTDTCVLETPDGTIEGARQVGARVTELLRMDAEAFTNCAYVRQGEVNKLINATPGQRQDMIDDLLQLGRLEDYRERAGQARLGVEDVLSERRGRLASLDEQIAEKEQTDLHGRLNVLESELADVEAKLERFEDNEAKARDTLAEAEAVLEAQAERRDELSELEAEIADLEETIATTEREREKLAERITACREEVGELESDRNTHLADMDLADPGPDAVEERLTERREELAAIGETIQSHVGERKEHAGEARSLEERADELDERAAAKREEAAELEAAIVEAEDTVADRRENLKELAREIESRIDRFEEAPIELGEAEDHCATLREKREALREALADRRATLTAHREQLEEAEGLLAAGNCPTCGQPVEGSPHVDSIEDDRQHLAELETAVEEVEAKLDDIDERIDRTETLVETEAAVERLRDERDTLEALIDEREAVLTEKRDRAETLREEAAELETEAVAEREAAETHHQRAETAGETVADARTRQSELSELIDRLESLRSIMGEITETESTATELETERGRLADLNDERRERLAEKRDRRTELAEAVDEDRIEQARTDRERAKEYLDRVTDRLEELRTVRDELRSDIGAIRAAITDLESLRTKRDALAAEVDAVERLHGEAEDLEAMYGDLRAELRRRNVVTLERMLNETFELVYGNDAYARIELDDAYELTVYQKDGQPLDPEQLSGGERALFNLSLRCAVYRLLAEGIDGPAPMPPLVLDEPTVFLDAGHVSRLVELVASMRELGVEQIIVVSHDEELVGAADDTLTVRKDATSNRSTVERSATPTALEAD